MSERNLKEAKRFSQVRKMMRATYDKEVYYWKEAHRKAEEGLLDARSELDKVTKHQKRFMGTFRLAHGVSMEQLHESVQIATSRQQKNQSDKEELLHRWEILDDALNIGLDRSQRSQSSRKDKIRNRANSEAQGRGTLSPLNEVVDKTIAANLNASQSLNALSAIRSDQKAATDANALVPKQSSESAQSSPAYLASIEAKKVV
ncbi:hypothetical protein SARC_06154 [Sphaeroforma arctica JP610]|uniref:STIM1/2 Orai1-activating region domain-containing protein n=1 Tax=Sphaeroforma arctica JP610 TaxID=667725 RepID=A0A0L0FXH0_9EUKA|nr:hypothetical protein SARC_06154 [Sphaeroforma arctica JP610]KNC81527.1 hypothetical protein SARC_06154 [Sphaeroforma arctica JP610]|eukprot:XP_014155429.1 hypothetical protein SARC_06154 [Sphaeroforma arctica JP610]